MATPEARAAYLEGACGRDVNLRRKVAELLKEHFSNDSLLAGPALDGDRPGVVESQVEESPAPCTSWLEARLRHLERVVESGKAVDVLTSEGFFRIETKGDLHAFCAEALPNAYASFLRDSE